MRQRLLMLAFAVATLAACGSREHPTGLDDEQFIEIMVRLRQASNRSGGDSIAFAAERDRVLVEHGVTRDDLGEYVKTHSTDLDHFAAIWDDVNERLQLEGPR